MVGKNRAALIIGLIIIFFIYLFLLNISLNREVIPSKFIMGKNSGFDLTKGSLNFGKIPLGSSATRSLRISNNFNKVSRIKITSSGEISQYIEVSDNNFILYPSESKNITFTCSPKNTTKFKEYNGEIIITTKTNLF
jgi:hypothetical protein